MRGYPEVHILKTPETPYLKFTKNLKYPSLDILHM